MNENSTSQHATDYPDMSDRRWAVQIKPHPFFLDTWSWEAMPLVDASTLGPTEFGGQGLRSQDDAKQMAQTECMKRNIQDAVLLGPDDVKEASNTDG